MPVSATPFYDREAPAVSSPAPADGLSLSAFGREGDGGRGKEGQYGMMVMMVWEEMVRGKRRMWETVRITEKRWCVDGEEEMRGREKR